jgi:hypothetical protein
MARTDEIEKLMALGGHIYPLANPLNQAFSFEKLQPAAEGGVVKQLRVKPGRGRVKAIQLPGGKAGISGGIDEVQSGKLGVPQNGAVRIECLANGQNLQRVGVVGFINPRFTGCS